MRESILNVMASSSDYAMATWRISRKVFPITRNHTRKVRAELVSMERDGLVAREPRYSTVNNTVWQLTEKANVRI